MKPPVLTAAVTPHVSLQVCKESRRAVLQKWKGRLSAKSGERREIPFDSTNDTILISYNNGTNWGIRCDWEEFGCAVWSTTTLATIQHLALDSRTLEQWWAVHPNTGAVFFCHFKSLRSLTVVTHAWAWVGFEVEFCDKGWGKESASDAWFEFFDAENPRLIEDYKHYAVKLMTDEYVKCIDDGISKKKIIQEDKVEVKVVSCSRNGHFCCASDDYDGQ